MKKILTVFLMIALFSCGKKEESKRNETPEALQETTKISRYSGRGDLVEEIYEENVSKSPDLQNLEKEIEDFDSREIQDEFGDYKRKSTDYYSAVTNHANSITDSVTKNKMLEIIKKSNNNYLSKIDGLEKLSNIITDKNKSISDSHNVLKILLTMSVIEKYQTENAPDKKEFHNVIKKQDSLIEKIQSKFPK